MSSSSSEPDNDFLSSEEEEDGEYHHHPQKSRSRNRKRHEATYGVFWEEEEETGPPRRRPHKKAKSGNVQFVKGATIQPVEEEVKDTVTSVEKKPTTVEDDAQPSSSNNTAEEEANVYFLSLLAKGQGRSKTIPSSEKIHDSHRTQREERLEDATPNVGGLGFRPAGASVPDSPKLDEQNEEENDDQDVAWSNPGLGMGGSGLGFRKKDPPSQASTNASHDLPISFGHSSRRSRTTSTSTQVRPDPNIGQWERHTKGIGMKLLSKMGYKGTGGLRPDSTDAPVPVKVRPNNLGLGFGSFQEAATTNKASAAAPNDLPTTKEPTRASAIPSAQQVLRRKTWKKRKANQTQESDLPFVSYANILEARKADNDEPMKIIDMTGGTTTADSPVLGQELVHNVSVLLGTYENRLHSESSFLTTHQRQRATFESDLESMKQQQQNLERREAKLQNVLELLDEVESLLANPLVELEAKVTQSQSILKRLAENFSAEERSEIRFSETLAPAVWGALFQPAIESWNPLEPGGRSHVSFFQVILQSGHHSNSGALALEASPEVRKAVLQRHIIPKLKKCWQSRKWNPTKDVSALEVYGTLLQTLRNVESNEKPPSTEETNVLLSDYHEVKTELSDIARHELMEGVVMKRLNQALANWDGTDLDRWILPWLEFVGPANVPLLVQECKRKLKTVMGNQSHQTKDDVALFHTSIQILSPWKGILKLETVEGIVNQQVIPRLARYLSQCEEANAERAASILLDMHHHGLLSDMMCLSLLEGELLPNLVHRAHKMSQEEKYHGSASVAKFYCTWKRLLFTQSDRLASLLSDDDGICQSLYALLLLSQKESGGPFSRTVNYRSVLSRRKKHAKRKAAEDVIREMEPQYVSDAHIKLGDMPTFRQVVEQLATSHGLLLIPKQGRRVDGRQVFSIGNVSVYFLDDVVYCGEGAHWRPMALDSLVELALGKAKS